MSPQRCAVTTRFSPSSTMTRTIWVGATLYRAPGRSSSASARYNAASSDLERYCVIRPHIAFLLGGTQDDGVLGTPSALDSTGRERAARARRRASPGRNQARAKVAAT